MTIFEGKKLALEKEEILKEKLPRLGFKPKLAVILVGNDRASKIFVDLKEKAAQRVGVEFIRKDFPEAVEYSELVGFIENSNKDISILGIMIQLPFPSQSSIINYQSSVLDSINPKKDVDCLTSENLGLLMAGKPRFLPATVRAVVEIIHNSELKIKNSNVVIVGGSILVGKPLAMVLSDIGATVTICRSQTEDLEKFTKEADILISATGEPDLITGDMIKEGAVVIDVGSPKGDVNFDEVSKKASFITPVPGGVGPLTVVSLFENLIAKAENYGFIRG
ncbi:MAG: tetrahydrofolate dehydrogenase/cyclohydrolase catalytic domain-containing protein [bacterium]|nr:tetrahydrofolate dehydrogenase/cyclohydrolase catalytic domain-containing protein [bacterium]